MMLQILTLASNRRKLRGFSLVELSIVLVILGLLVGGVLSGQALIRASQLRAVTQESQKYRTAILAFRDKYFQLPGDMTNATSFWGAADGGDGIGTDCRGAQTNDQRTCNGNGDGLIGDHPDLEYSRLWQHLANAGLIEGSYKGTGIPYVTGCAPDTGGCLFPGTRSGRGLWQLVYEGASYHYSYYDNRNILILSDVIVTVGSLEQGLVFVPAEAYSIDTKLDDGKPGTGNIMATRPGICDTSTINDKSDAARATAQYQLSVTTASCVLSFVDVM